MPYCNLLQIAYAEHCPPVPPATWQVHPVATPPAVTTLGVLIIDVAATTTAQLHPPPRAKVPATLHTAVTAAPAPPAACVETVTPTKAALETVKPVNVGEADNGGGSPPVICARANDGRSKRRGSSFFMGYLSKPTTAAEQAVVFPVRA